MFHYEMSVQHVLWNGWDMVAGTSHLGENFVKPLQGSVQVHLDPAGGWSHILKIKKNVNFNQIPKVVDESFELCKVYSIT